MFRRSKQISYSLKYKTKSQQEILKIIILGFRGLEGVGEGHTSEYDEYTYICENWSKAENLMKSHFDV